MKGERRHELEKNELADWIASLVAKIKPYQNVILGVVVLLVGASVAYVLITRASDNEARKAWDDLLAVMNSGTMNPAEYEAVAAKYPGTNTAWWASVLAGEDHLTRGCDELFTNKATGRDELEKAKDEFLQVLDECRLANLRERATFGLAQANEASGELEKAMENWSSPTLKESGQTADRGYQGVLNLWPDGTYAAMARQRLDDLQRPSIRKFYDQFAKWEPKPPLAEEPGTPGVRPPTDLKLPDDQPLFTPSEPSGPTKPGGAGASKAKPDGFPQPEPPKKPAPSPPPKEDSSKPAP